MLSIHFDDVRPEEYSPSYAWWSSRIDFILKKEKIAVEVKMTRESLKDKQIWEQLIVDIARYEWHPDCETLVCFVYDSLWLVWNPVWLENDLEQSNTYPVKVFIRPQ